MKKIFALMMAALMVCSVSYAQTAKEAKAIEKNAKKEAKKLTKEGWKVAPGQLPLEMQLQKAYTMQFETDENGEKKYFIGDAMSPGGTFDGAKMQATELAKLDMASKIEERLTAITESTLGNTQMTSEQAATVIETVQSSKSLIEQRLARTMTITELYKTLPNKTVQVRIVLAMNSKVALENAKAAIEQKLREKGEDLHEQLDAMWAQMGL